MNFNKSWV